MNLPSIELLLKLGANQHYKYKATLLLLPPYNMFDLIITVGMQTVQERLEKLKKPYIRLPINTIDIFYPDTKGYRKNMVILA